VRYAVEEFFSTFFEYKALLLWNGIFFRFRFKEKVRHDDKIRFAKARL